MTYATATVASISLFQPQREAEVLKHLLRLLAEHVGKVMTHRQILTAVWGEAHSHDVEYLRVYVRQLRSKLGDDPANPWLIQTEPGVGLPGEGGVIEPGSEIPSTRGILRRHAGRAHRSSCDHAGQAQARSAGRILRHPPAASARRVTALAGSPAIAVRGTDS